MNQVEYDLNNWFHNKKPDFDGMDILTLGYVSKPDPTWYDIFNAHY